MIFFGKWTFGQPNTDVQIDMASGTLKVAAVPADGSDRFNAYGTAAAFVLQAANGKYVVTSGSGYAATSATSTSVNQFTLEDAGSGAVRVVDLGINGKGPRQSYWNVASGALNSIDKSNSPPATTSFNQSIVTVGLSAILATGFQTPQPDLTWVDLSNADFTQAQQALDFSQTILTNANLSSTKFEMGIPFDTCSGQSVNFAGATLAGCSFNSSHLEKSNFTCAVLTGADVSSAWFNDATLTGIHLNQQSNIANAHFNGAKLQGADFTNCGNVFQTDFTGADLTGAKFTGSSITGTMILNDANLTNANLNNAWYWIVTDGATNYVIAQGYGQSWYDTSLGVAPGTNYNAKPQFFIPRSLKDSFQPGAVTPSLASAFQLNGGITLTGGATLATRQYVSIYPKMLQFNSNTNLTGTNLQCLDLRGYDLSKMVMAHADFSGSKLDNVDLSGSDLSYANLSGVTLTGGIPMFGAILSNANFTNADLTSAQMGALSELFAVPSSSTSEYNRFLTALTSNNPADVTAVFAECTNNKIQLTNPTIIPSVFASGRVWTVLSGQQSYSVRLVTTNAGTSLQVSQPATAAVLTNAYLRGATLTAANLYQVRASGIQLYGGAKLDGNAILEGAQFNNGNLANANLKQAALYGVNFDYCILNNADFTGAHLTVNSSGGQASFNSANLQGAVFSDSQLANAIFTDAAVSVPLPSSTQPAGVWLFDSDPQYSQLLIAELNTASDKNKNFSMDKQAANVLKPGVVPSPIISQFAAQQIPLSPTAIVSVMGEGPYWQVTDGSNKYVIFETCDKANYMPALGVAFGTTPVVDPKFFIPYSLESQLIPGPAPATVVNAFKTNGITLSSAATVSVLQQFTDWQIADVSGNYSLWLGLSMSCTLQVTVSPSTPFLQQLFTNYSSPLSRRATIRTGKAAGVWTINNDSDNPFNPIVNYINFNVVQNAAGGLDVYGSKLRIRRLVGANQQEYQNISCDITRLAASDLVNSTTCPNSLLVSSNTKDGLPVDQWMRSRVLPRAPLCVPSGDGTYYCPR